MVGSGACCGDRRGWLADGHRRMEHLLSKSSPCRSLDARIASTGGNRAIRPAGTPAIAGVHLNKTELKSRNRAYHNEDMAESRTRHTAGAGHFQHSYLFCVERTS